MLIMAKIDQKQDRKLSELPAKHAALVLMDDAGIDKKDISIALDYTGRSVDTIASRLTKFKFTGNVKSQKKAHNLIDSLASGKLPKETDIKDLKCSTALKAATYISDHNDPIAKGPEESGNQVNNYTQIININEYRVDNSVKTIDNQDDKDKDNKAIELSP